MTRGRVLYKYLGNHKSAILIFTWVAFLLLLRWNSFTTPFERDEGAYAYVASEIKSGHLPYETVFDHKPPLIYIVYYLSQFINDQALWPPRLIAFLCLALTIIVTGYIAEKEFGKKSGMLLVWIIAPMFSLPLLTPFAANTEIFMLLPMMLALLLYLKYKENENEIYPFLFGILSSISLFFKPLDIFVFLFLTIMWVYYVYKKRGVQNVPRVVFYILSGGLITALLILLPFFVRNLEVNFYKMVIEYNKQFVFGRVFIKRFARFAYHFLKSWPLLFALSFWYVLKRPPRWWFYLSLVFVSLIAIFYTDLGHYYLLIIPFWALIAISSINSISKQLTKKLPLGFEKIRLLLSFIVFISLLIPIYKQIFISPKKFITYVHGRHNPFEEAVILSKHLAMQSDATDTVYLAGFEPEILKYSNRKSASKFIYAYPQIFNTPRKEVYQKELFNEFKQANPDFIVLSSEFLIKDKDKSNEQPMKFWNELIESRYMFVGGVIREKDEVYWKDASDAIKTSRYRLLLYKIKEPE